VDTLAYDVRYAIRALLRIRRITATAILTLALGVGATTTMFSVTYAALMRPLPFAEPERLVMLYTTRTSARTGLERGRWAPAEIARLHTPTSLESVGTFTRASVTVANTDPAVLGAPEQVDAEIVSPSYFRVLRISPIVGRLFTDPEDLTPGAHPIALLGEALWRRRFAADPSVVGRSMVVNAHQLTVVGILPMAFAGLSGRSDIWLPTTMAPLLTYADYLTTPQHFINVIGRLRPGVAIERSAIEAATLAPHVLDGEPRTSTERASWSATVWPLSRARVDLTVERSVLLLLGAASCLLLITCVNVTSLLLARAESRRRDIAVRLAIGCSRGRLIRQLLTEAFLVAAAGGGVALLLSRWAIDVIAVSAPAIAATARNDYGQVAAFAAPALDGVVVAFAVGVAAATTLLVGLLPALQASRPELSGALKQGGPSASGRRHRVLGSLVVAEVALAVLLLSVARQRNGFDGSNVLTFWVNPPGSRDMATDSPAAIERVLARIRATPGVVSAAVSRCTPLSTRCARTNVFFPGHTGDPATAPVVGRHYVSAEYIRTLGVPLRAGRWLTDADRTGRPAVAVINETAARRFWPGENPLGKRVWFGGGTGFSDPSRPVEIVGVVGDVKYGPLEDTVGPDFYTSYLQFTYASMLVLVKTATEPAAMVPAMRDAIAAADRDMPMYDVQRLDDRAADALSRPRFNAALVASFAAAALLLAAVGVYGVAAYGVSARTREIAVRLALGAAPARVRREVLVGGARLAAAGAMAGCIASVACARFVRTIAFGVSTIDPLVLAATAAAMLIVAILAAWLPARRASIVDPIGALRAE
jgi:putative ABC transport system permease protein